MKTQQPKRTTLWFFIIVFFLLVIGILSTGFFFYQSQKLHIKTDAQNNLAAVADLKVDQILQWRNERMSDADVIFEDALFARQVETYFKAPGGMDRRQELLNSMRTFQNHFQYESVLLIDSKGAVRLAISVHGDTIGSHAQALIKQAFPHRKVILSDLYSNNFSPSVHMSLIIPLILSNRKDSTTVGALLLRIDPNRLLFPLIQKWPTPSPSSETLLLEQEGDEIIYLNELRHKKNTTYSFRLPISNKELPASMAARGIEGPVEGKDYRNVPVLAAIRKIQGTPWFLIAKVDQEEVFAPLLLQAWIEGLGMFLLIIATGAIIGFRWRHQQARFYREQYEAQVERQALVKHFEYLIKYANDIILLVDMDGRIVEANDQACRTYGYTQEEIHKLTIQNIRTTKSPSEIENQKKQEAGRGGLVFETEHQRKDGTKFPVEISSQIIKIDNAKYLQCIIRDITDRKKAEVALLESEEMHRALVNQSSDAIYVLQNRRLVFVNPAWESIFGYSLKEVLADNFNFLSIVAPESQPDVLERLQQRDSGKEVTPRYEMHGITKHGVHIDLDVSVSNITWRGAPAIQGIYRDVTNRNRAERALRESEERYRELYMNAPIGVYRTTPDGKILLVNPRFLDMLGFTSLETINVLNLEQEGFEPSYSRAYFKQRMEQEGEIRGLESIWHRRDGLNIFVRESAKAVRGPDGSILYYDGMAEDITDRKRTEEQLYNANQMLQLVFDNIPQRIFWKDKELRYLGCNRSFATDAGYHHSSELIGKDDFAMAWKETAKLYRADDALVMETNSTKLNYEEPQNRPDGSLLWLRTSKVPLHDQTGQVIGVLGMYEDITERKQAEEALRESEYKYRSLSENSLEGIGLSIENRVIYANRTLLDIFGYENLKEFLAKPLLELVAPESQNTIREMLRKSKIGEPYEKRFTYKIVRKNGEKRDVEISTDHVRIGNEVFTQSTFRDITERKQAEEALRQSEERYRRITQAVTDYIYTVQIKDSRAVETHHGAGCIGITGYTNEEFNADPYLWFNMIVDQDRYIIQDITQQLLAKEDVPPLEHRIVRKDGAIRWVMNTPVPHYDEDGKLLSYDGLVQDITERKVAEEAMRESEEQFRSLAEQSPNMIFINYKGRVVFANKRCEDIMEYTKEEFYSPDFNFKNITAPEYRTIVEENFRRHQHGEDVPPLDYAILTKNGKRLETILATQVINYKKDKAILGIVTDITERKQAEEALRQTHAFNDLLIQTMPFGMDIVDEEGNILFVSKTMRDMLTADVVDQCCWKVYKDNNQQCQDCPLKREISFGKPDVIETTGFLGGKTFQISHVGMMYEGRKAMLEVFQDITEQKKLQQELLQSQKMLSIGTLAGGIAHDFNNILAIILGYTSMLHSMKDNPKKFSDGVNAIQQAVDRGTALVRQILTFARKTDVAFEPMDVSTLTRELVSMLQQTFPKIITFNKEIERKLPLINADHTQIHRILLNLCVNARDAMPNGGEITIKAHMAAGNKVRERFPAAAEENYICIIVSDTGVGMDETTRNRIFDPFFTTKEKEKGTGLGLSVAYGVVQAHHGFIDVESAVGKGTAFILYLPVPKEISLGLEAGKTGAHILGGTETLLIVEDEDFLLDIIRLHLEMHGYKILTAKDGMEAVDVYKQHAHEIALVISDMGLPKLSGDDEFKKLKELNSAVNMILASGYFEPDKKTALEGAGVAGFLQKPYVIEEVLEKIRKALEKT